jgi:hypothetical protein
LDRIFIQVLRKWHGALNAWWEQRPPPSLDAE